MGVFAGSCTGEEIESDHSMGQWQLICQTLECQYSDLCGPPAEPDIGVPADQMFMVILPPPMPMRAPDASAPRQRWRKAR